MLEEDGYGPHVAELEMPPPMDELGLPPPTELEIPPPMLEEPGEQDAPPPTQGVEEAVNVVEALETPPPTELAVVSVQL